MTIKNFSALALTPARKAALEIIEAGLTAINSAAVIRETVRLENNQLFIKNKKYDLSGVKKLLIVGIGKCALEAGIELEKILSERLTGGIIIDVHQSSKVKRQKSKLEIFTGTHPLPSPQNIDITRKIIAQLSVLSEKDFVIFIISGGGSTLLCQPQDLTCHNEADILTFLFQKGATIQEINTVRKHISLARGGWLTKYLYPATGIALIFSDVPGNALEFVASGPTIKDTTTVSDARKIIDKYKIEENCGFKCNLLETPKEDRYFEKIENILLVSNQTALTTMKLKATELGFKAIIKTDILAGEAKTVGQMIVEDLKAASNKIVLLYGGETTVTVTKPGKGGRNQELVLSALLTLEENQLILAIASDGRDNTDFAGAIVDVVTKTKARKLNLEPAQYLEDNNSYNFFRQTGDFILTGDTGINVSDLVIAIKT